MSSRLVVRAFLCALGLAAAPAQPIEKLNESLVLRQRTQ